MIEQQARVIRASAGRATVRIGAQAGCPSCEAGQGCGAGIFGKLIGRRPVELTVANAIGAEPGQGVTVGVEEAVFLRLVWRFYGWPLVAGLVAGTLGHALAAWIGLRGVGVDLATLAGAVVAGFAVLKLSGSGTIPVFDPGDVRLLRERSIVECGPGARPHVFD